MCHTQEIKKEENKKKIKPWRSTINKIISCQSFIMRMLYIKFKALLLGGGKIHRSDERMMYAFFLILVFGITSLISLMLLNFYANNNLDKGESFGQFGDFLGGVLNPIFTLMTFFGVIVTIALQKIELRAAREEYKKSADALSTQAFENTFFNMLNLQQKIVSDLEFSSQKLEIDYRIIKNAPPENNAKRFKAKVERDLLTYKGRHAFGGCLNLLKRLSGGPQDTFCLYKHIQVEHNHIFGHYFRSLYRIIKFINDHPYLEDTDRLRYASILRAQLSRDELSLILLNCMDNMVDNGEFRELLRCYHILEHIDISLSKSSYKLDGVENVYEETFLTNGLIISRRDGLTDFLTLENGYYGAFGKHPFFIENGKMFT